MLKRILSSQFFVLILVLIICIPIILPYFHPGYFPTHDGEWAVVRLSDMFRTLKDLQFPPRMSGALNFGYGYPLFNFAYPFPYYLGILLYLPFHSFVTSIKTMFVLSVFLSSLFMYFASNQLWKNRTAAVVSAILYIYLPYRMVDLYVRGSLGESLSFVLFPLIFYLSLKLFDSAFSRVPVVFLSISIGVLIMTHNIMTVLFLPVLITFVLIRVFKEKRHDTLQSFLLCLLLGLGLSFFFWFPALFEKGNILLSKIPIADRALYFVTPSQLFIPSWGYGTPTASGGFSYQLGIVQIIAVLTSIIFIGEAFVKNRFTQTPAKFYSMILTGIYIICFVMLFSFTSIIWRTIPLLKEINYPWTLHAILGFITALLLGFVSIQGKYFKYLSVLLCIAAVIIVFPYAKPIKFNNNPDQYYLTNEATTTSSSELMPLWVKDFPKEHFKDKVEVLNGTAQISNLRFDSKSLKFNYKSDQDITLQINTIYYPGWVAYLNNDLVKINYDNPKGVMQIEGSKFRNEVLLQFGETLPRMFSDIISIGALVVILFILMRPILLFKS